MQQTGTLSKVPGYRYKKYTIFEILLFHPTMSINLTSARFVGDPCKYGHGNIRYTSNKHCVECQRLQKLRNKGKISDDEWAEYKSLKIPTDSVQYRAKANLAKVRRYKAAKSNRCPAWADLAKIKEFYANCPTGMVIDHIIPLRGELVSGLHVHNNLQYLTSAENAAKANKFEIV